MWGYLKDRVYSNKPVSSQELKNAIVMEVSRLPSEMVDRAITHKESRAYQKLSDATALISST